MENDKEYIYLNEMMDHKSVEWNDRLLCPKCNREMHRVKDEKDQDAFYCDCDCE